jgi:hypothetical protein
MGSHASDRVALAPGSATTATHRRVSAFAACLLFLASMSLSRTASAVDGCEVLLCLAAPNGWSGIAQCVPPMREFLRDMALGHAFPSCAMAGNPSTGQGSFAQTMPANHYNQCPAGTSALPAGARAIQSATGIPTNGIPAWLAQQTVLTGIGEGSDLAPSTATPLDALPPKVCAAGAPIGQVNVPIGLPGLAGGLGPVLVPVPVYASVTLLQPNTSANVIGVWIDGQLYNQVHW